MPSGRAASALRTRAARANSRIERPPGAAPSIVICGIPSTGAYFDYRWTRRAPIPRISAATLYPLFVSAASKPQAAAVAASVRGQLLRPGGVVTTPLETGQQWDAPNGWAPLQWIAVDGLRRNGEERLAESIACRFMHTVQAVYEDSGKLVEKYDVVRTNRKGGGGEYPTQDGFGWTNGVMRKLESLYPADTAARGAVFCPQPPDGEAGPR